MKNSIPLYQEYYPDFKLYVDGLTRHQVKLSDLRLKQICRKWDIGVSDDLQWIEGIWNPTISQTVSDLFKLRK
jgi:hypothetical protein